MLLPDTGRSSVQNHTISAAATMKIERAETKGTMDRRVARTRALLQDALVALIPELGYAAITVENICEKANVGRSTFYTHYVGKDDLRSATIDAHLRSLTHRRVSAEPETSGRLFAFSLPMLEHAHAFRALHHALLSSSGETIHDEMRERVRRAVRSELVEKRAGATDVPVEFAVQYISGAFLALLAWWIAADITLSPAQVDVLFQQMVREGVGTKGT
jgi:AcrR family transcriptional regulator